MKLLHFILGGHLEKWLPYSYAPYGYLQTGDFILPYVFALAPHTLVGIREGCHWAHFGQIFFYNFYQIKFKEQECRAVSA